MQPTPTRTAALALGMLAVTAGAWALVAPRSFYDVVATYPPYNEHLLHDLGAFQLGIAAALVAGLAGRTGLGVTLWAGAIGASAHAGSHWIDADLGGRPSDPALTTILAGVLVAGAVLAEMRGARVVGA